VVLIGLRVVVRDHQQEPCGVGWLIWRRPWASTIVAGMSTTVDIGLGRLLSEARTALGASLQDVADSAGCSSAYVHKLEQDRVRTPSPRVLAGLTKALGLEYDTVMQTVGYVPAKAEAAAAEPATLNRFSNAHIVHLLEELKSDVATLSRLVAEVGSNS
jgi:transcriptional regulator with XRE-family HTH domain